jgi:cell division septal protein FtsQ
MKSRQRPRKKGRRFETAGTLAIGRVRGLARPHLRWLWRVLLAVVVVIVGVAVWGLLDDRFYVYDADVVGTVRLSQEQVFWASDLPGLHVLWVNADQVEGQILAELPSLESAEVACQLPSNCTITVVERQPRMMWNDSGQLWGVDANGLIFPAEEAFTEAWVVRGPLPRDEDELLVEPVRVALAELWTSGVEIAPELVYVPNRGFMIIDSRGWRVIVGQGTGMKGRLEALETIAADLEARGVDPKFVDVRFPDAPYYSLTNEW